MRAFFLILFMFGLFLSQIAQPVIDKVIAVIGKYPVLLSELETNHYQKLKEEPESDKCKSLEDLIFSKLLLAQADRDSVTIADAEVENELNRRMAYYIQMMGSEEKFESFYGTRVNVFKDQMRDDVHNQLLGQKMQQKIVGDTKLTPSEVRMYYNSLPEDSLPVINSEIEIAQIVRKAPITEQAKKDARELIESYRQRVLKGESMSVLAALYTDDPGSSKTGGRYETVMRGQMVPEFEATAFRLKNGDISEVFETSYGYHFIQMIARKGEIADLRHILVSPKLSQADVFKEKFFLDTLQKQILENKITFEEAARKYSTDKETKNNGGLMVNPGNGTTRWSNDDISHLDQVMGAALISAFDKMNIGDVTIPMQFMDTDSKPGYRILMLKSRIDPHKANLKEDYARLLQMATFEKQKKMVSDWITKRSKYTYIKIDPEFLCKFEHKWVIIN